MRSEKSRVATIMLGHTSVVNHSQTLLKRHRLLSFQTFSGYSGDVCSAHNVDLQSTSSVHLLARRWCTYKLPYSGLGIFQGKSTYRVFSPSESTYNVILTCSEFDKESPGFVIHFVKHRSLAFYGNKTVRKSTFYKSSAKLSHS